MKLNELIKVLQSDSSVVINLNDEIIFEEIAYFYYELNDKYDDYEVYNVAAEEDDCGIPIIIIYIRKGLK